MKLLVVSKSFERGTTGMDSFKLKPVEMCPVMAKNGMPLNGRKTRHVVLENF